MFGLTEGEGGALLIILALLGVYFGKALSHWVRKKRGDDGLL